MTTPRPINLPPPKPIPVGMEPPPMVSARPTPSASSRREPKGKAQSGKPSSRFAILNAFVDTALANCTPAEVRVWLILSATAAGWDRPDEPGGHGARRAGLTDRSARRAIDGLIHAGLVRRVRRGGPNRGSSCYRIRGTPRNPS
ncbi:MAG: hypothetical protein U0840_02055 [Gemmataceae bacterium]